MSNLQLSLDVFVEKRKCEEEAGVGSSHADDARRQHWRDAASSLQTVHGVLAAWKQVSNKHLVVLPFI